MIRQEPHVVKAVAASVRNYPDMVLWLESVYQTELKRLPYAQDNPALFQGRCQMVGELLEFAKESPAIAAKL